MLIKATRLHPGVPLHAYVFVLVMIDVVVTEVGIVIKVVTVAITESITWWTSFLAFSLSSIKGHFQSPTQSFLSSTLTSVVCPWPLAMMTDPGPDSQM